MYVRVYAVVGEGAEFVCVCVCVCVRVYAVVGEEALHVAQQRPRVLGRHLRGASATMKLLHSQRIVSVRASLVDTCERRVGDTEL